MKTQNYQIAAYLNADMFHHVTLKNTDGSPLRARRTGQNKLWKRSPDRFQIPAKHGLYDPLYISERNMHEWIPVIKNSEHENSN